MKYTEYTNAELKKMLAGAQSSYGRFCGLVAQEARKCGIDMDGITAAEGVKKMSLEYRLAKLEIEKLKLESGAR